jgi:hypothetical protein
MTKGVRVVYSTLLFKSFSHQSSLKPINGAIKLLFYFIDPLISNYIVLQLSWTKSPSTISN